MLVHGLGEHCEASVYDWLVRRFETAGLAAWRFDLRGHGKSSGRLLSIDTWADYLHDLDSVLGRVGERAVVMGFSMGGLLVLDHLRRNPEMHRATIAMAPPLGDPSVPRLLLHFARGMNRVAPHFIVRSPWLPKFSRFESEELRAYRGDPMIRCAVSPRLTTAMIDASREVRRHEQWPKPLLLLQGENDQICPARGTIEFARRVGADLMTFENARHHLLLEECREGLTEGVVDWVRANAR